MEAKNRDSIQGCVHSTSTLCAPASLVESVWCAFRLMVNIQKLEVTRAETVSHVEGKWVDTHRTYLAKLQKLISKLSSKVFPPIVCRSRHETLCDPHRWMPLTLITTSQGLSKGARVQRLKVALFWRVVCRA